MLQGRIYFVLLDLCWMYALLRGGLPERVGTSILAIGSVLTVAAASGPANSFASVEVGIFFIDVATFVAFVALALRAERYWPLWIAALQLIGTAGHGVKLMDPEVIRRAYAFVLAFGSYPMLAILALGTWRHQQRFAKFGVDRSWSSFSARSAPPQKPGPIS